jgi:hypothetical protein
VFEKRVMNSTEAQAHGTSQHHGTDKGAGQEPECATADLYCPETHGDHDQQVIKSGQGMNDSCLHRSCQVPS